MHVPLPGRYADIPGSSEIQFTRSHIIFRDTPHRQLKTAVVVCNESSNIPLGLALVNKLMGDASTSERLCQDIYWLVWDVFHELNHWTSILENTRMQLKIEVICSNFVKNTESICTNWYHRKRTQNIPNWI